MSRPSLPPAAALAATLLTTLALMAPLAGCAGGEPLRWNLPYRMDIVQGNVVTSEQAARVRPGMSREQVRDQLGSPMLSDVFHADRWDYVFTIVRQGTPPQQRRVVAHFNGDRLERLDAGELPSEREFVAAISRTRTSPVPRLELSPEQAAALPKPARPAAAAELPQPQGAVRLYPPLEPS